MPPSPLQAFVSADNMNVFYIGVDNPISVTVPEVDPSMVSINVTGGTSQGGKGKYTINCTTLGNCVIDVYAKTDKGNEKVNSFTYRAKRIPNPVTKFGPVVGDGSLTTAEIRAFTAITTQLVNFDFEANFTIVSFNVMVVKTNSNSSFSPVRCTGSTFSVEARNLINTIHPGDLLLITNVVVKGPDGISNKIPGVVVTAR